MGANQSCPPGSGSGAGAHRTVVARGAFSAVEHCRCGAIYLTIGPVSVRVDVSALSELGEVITQASFILNEYVPGEVPDSAPEPGEAAGERGAGSDSEPTVESSPPNKLN